MHLFCHWFYMKMLVKQVYYWACICMTVFLLYVHLQSNTKMYYLERKQANKINVLNFAELSIYKVYAAHINPLMQLYEANLQKYFWGYRNNLTLSLFYIALHFISLIVVTFLKTISIKRVHWENMDTRPIMAKLKELGVQCSPVLWLSCWNNF